MREPCRSALLLAAMSFHGRIRIIRRLLLLPFSLLFLGFDLIRRRSHRRDGLAPVSIYASGAT